VPALPTLLLFAAFGGLAPAERADRQPADSLDEPACAARPTSDSAYASPALRALVTRACAANRRLPPPFVRYAARVESEAGLVLDLPVTLPGAMAGTAAARSEVAGQVEQIATSARFERRGDYEMRVVGYRLQALGFGPSALTYLPTVWTVPSLYGNRLALMFTERVDSTRRARRRDGAGSARRASPRPFATAFHPLAEDRDAVYRYSGGDTVATVQAGGGRRIPIVRIRVEPVRTPPGRAWMFDGELLVDGTRAQLVRMRGRFLATGIRDASRLGRTIRATTGLDGDVFVDLENGEVLGRYWLPRVQRLEFQATSGVSESRAVIRVISRFAGYDVTERATLADGPPAPPSDSLVATTDDRAIHDAAPGGATGDTLYVLPARRTFAPADSVRRYAAWQRELGRDTREAGAHDFDEFLARRRRASGPPVLRLQGRRPSDFVRTNRVEGLYTGVAGLLAFRDRAPGALVRATGGWAWGERTARGGVEGALPLGAWLLTARGERALESTNDFDASLGGALSMFAALGGDPYDYVDRRAAALGVTRELGRAHTAAWRVEASIVSDVEPRVAMQREPLGRRAFRALRPVDVGRYALVTGSLDFGRNVLGAACRAASAGSSPPSVPPATSRGPASRRACAPGGFEGRWCSRGAWTRARSPAGVPRRSGSTRWAACRDCRATRTRSSPGIARCSGARSRCTTCRSRHGRCASAAGSSHRSLRRSRPGGSEGGRGRPRRGARRSRGSGWETTGRVRATADLRVRFFGGAFGAGFARPVDRAAPWRFVASFDGQL
jgi:hypothetical protein